MMKYNLHAALYMYQVTAILALPAGLLLVILGGDTGSWPMVVGGSVLLLYGWALGSRLSVMLSASSPADSLASKMEHLLYTASALQDKGKRGAN